MHSRSVWLVATTATVGACQPRAERCRGQGVAVHDLGARQGNILAQIDSLKMPCPEERSPPIPKSYH